MKLSEAMKLGAMLRPQGRGVYFSNEGTCALGAAAEAVGIRLRNQSQLSKAEKLEERERVHQALVARWPWLTTWKWLRITWRNDVRGHSRERIAAWIASIEPAEPAPSPVPALDFVQTRANG